MRPALLELLGSVVHRFQFPRVQAIQALPALFAHRDQADLAEHTQVLRHRRLGNPEPGHDLPDRLVPLGQHVDDRAPPRFGDCVEYVRCGCCPRHGEIIFPYRNMSSGAVSYSGHNRSPSFVSQRLVKARIDKFAKKSFGRNWSADHQVPRRRWPAISRSAKAFRTLSQRFAARARRRRAMRKIPVAARAAAAAIISHSFSMGTSIERQLRLNSSLRLPAGETARAPGPERSPRIRRPGGFRTRTLRHDARGHRPARKACPTRSPRLWTGIAGA